MDDIITPTESIVAIAAAAFTIHHLPNVWMVQNGIFEAEDLQIGCLCERDNFGCELKLFSLRVTSEQLVLVPHDESQLSRTIKLITRLLPHTPWGPLA